MTTAFGLFAPTGRHTAGANDNVGKGMWSYEFSGGTTLYLDEAKSLSFATSAFWELHSKKDGTIFASGPSRWQVSRWDNSSRWKVALANRSSKVPRVWEWRITHSGNYP